MATTANTLVVVDDEEDVGALIATAGTTVGYQASVITNPMALPEALACGDPTVLVLDLRMPGYDGVEMLAEFGRRRLTSQLLLVSGMDTRTLQAAERIARDHGLKLLGSMTKPFDMPGLREMLSKAL